MAYTIHTSIDIAASPEIVWAILTDFPSYPEWNPFVSHIEGPIEEGEKIKVSIDGMKFEPILQTVIPHEELSWKGKLWINGLFDGEHIFQINDNQDGTITFVQKEHFKGLLIPILKKKLELETKLGFEKMNIALRDRVEELG